MTRIPHIHRFTLGNILNHKNQRESIFFSISSKHFQANSLSIHPFTSSLNNKDNDVYIGMIGRDYHTSNYLSRENDEMHDSTNLFHASHSFNSDNTLPFNTESQKLSKSQMKKLEKMERKRIEKEEKRKKIQMEQLNQEDVLYDTYTSIKNNFLYPKRENDYVYKKVKYLNFKLDGSKLDSRVTHQESTQPLHRTLNEKSQESHSKSSKAQINQELVRTVGWVQRVRHHGKGKISFIELRDGSCFKNLQCVFEGDLALRAFYELKPEQSIEIWGNLIENERAPYGRELHVEYFRLIGDVKDLFSINQDTKVDVSLKDRHLFIRESKRMASILKFRSLLLSSLRRYFETHDHFEVTPPTLVQTEVEGGSTLFRLDYFGENAYLTQSSQLYLESVLPVLGDVFCIAQSYRAEKSQTPRHLAEYTHLEVERAFIDFEGLLQSIEDMVQWVVKDTVDRGEELLREINPSIFEASHYIQKLLKQTNDRVPFKRMTYHDCIAFCNEHKILPDENSTKPFAIGDDITDRPERQMIEKIGEPVFMIRFPAEMKSFYMERCIDDSSLTNSVDLLLPGVGEAVGGSMRIWNYEELEAAFKRENIDPAPYYWYIDQRKFGSVPHGGYGLGVERLLMWILGLPHIREACLYPRYMGRCSP